MDATRRLDPGWTEWEKDVLYVSYDLTALLSAAGGPAALGVRLGDGWYSQQQNAPSEGYTHPTYGPARFLLQLNLQTNDGLVVSVVSDGSWMGREGSVSSSSPYMGEAYSAMRERDGWSSASFTDSLTLWINASLLPSPLVPANSTLNGLRLQTMEPIRFGDAALHIATSGTALMGEAEGVRPLIGADLLGGGVLHPVNSPQVDQGVTIWDMGQTFSGTCTFTFSSLPPRYFVSVRYAEVMRPRSALGLSYYEADYSYIRGASSTDTYIAKGVDGETFTPKFTVQSVPIHTPRPAPPYLNLTAL